MNTLLGVDTMGPVRCYIGLGANIGDSRATIAEALKRLNELPNLTVDTVAPLYRSAPIGYTEQNYFINTVAEVSTTLTPRQLLTALQQIENDLGRVRVMRWGPRTVDLDILLYGEQTILEPELQVPHPRMTQRAFVMVPLADLNPGLVIDGQKAQLLARRLAEEQEIYAEQRRYKDVVKKMNCNYSLYLVTDRAILEGRDLYHAVEAALQGGVTLVQLREKHTSSRDFYQIALGLKDLTCKYQVPLLINDRLDIALAVDADGIHIGQEDLPLQVVREMLGPQKIVGYSVANIEEAVYGERNGADYLGAGPVYATQTKSTPIEPLGVEGLRSIKEAVSIPVVGIGGINVRNVSQVRRSGVDGISVVSAILGSFNPANASRELYTAWHKKD
ncbi:Thiamine-phosphate synthase [Sporotomaculum syntrophicum]|uniref:Thiamine-phosphate synthase n=2 Tax=Sporotomaculum syntrophicum TaxID=182264 RepID=A0A9D2WRI9_9FIRM|nr:Thiamine-phosphate synthase [Sporotomaculum syntrophicum]